MPSHQPENIKKIADAFPELKVVVCHLLAPMEDRLDEWMRSLNPLRKSNIWFDISALPKIIGTDNYPYLQVHKVIAEAKDILGIDRLMWGT